MLNWLYKREILRFVIACVRLNLAAKTIKKRCRRNVISLHNSKSCTLRSSYFVTFYLDSFRRENSQYYLERELGNVLCLVDTEFSLISFDKQLLQLLPSSRLELSVELWRKFLYFIYTLRTFNVRNCDTVSEVIRCNIYENVFFAALRKRSLSFRISMNISLVNNEF